MLLNEEVAAVLLMKRCSRCGESKPLSEFYTAGGKCKICKRAQVRASPNRKTNLARYQREKRATPEGRLKWRARKLVERALVKGTLVRGACAVALECEGRIEAHHEDYAEPLAVDWLCSKHHAAADAARVARIANTET